MKKKCVKKMCLFAAISGILLIITGCCNPMGGTEESGRTATVQIMTASSNGRAVAIPNLVSQIKSYKVTITGGINPPPAASFNLTDPIIFTNVRLANGYTVTIVAHNADKTSQIEETILGSGSVSFDVNSENAQVNVTVAAGNAQGNGKGTVDLLIQYPKTENIISVTASFSGPGTETNTFDATVKSVTGNELNNASRITTDPIKSGWYTMTLTFDRGVGNQKTGLSEVVYIYDNGITNQWVIDSSGTYDAVRVYDDIFNDQYSYLSNIKFNTTGSLISDPTSLNLVSLPYFISERESDANRYVIYCYTDKFQFLPVTGRDDQTIRYAWKEGDLLGNQEVLETDLNVLGGISPALTAANGTLYIEVKASGGSKTTYRIQVIQGFRLTYNANGATSGTPPAPQPCKYGETPKVLGNTNNMAKTGYIFSGWNTKNDGSGTTYFADNLMLPLLGNATLYARWKTASVEFSVTAVNPAAAVLDFSTPDATIIHKGLTKPTQLTVNLAQKGVAYKKNGTTWSYTGSDGKKRVITNAANTAGDKDSSLIWTPPFDLLPGDYTFTVLAVVIVNRVEMACTGYFVVTIAL